MINGIGAMARGSEARRTTAPRTAGAFRLHESATSVGSSVGEVACSSMAGLLALQDEESSAVQDREARGRGEDLLEELADLQRDLLGHGLGEHRLRRLASLADGVPHAADRRLRDLVGAIALRARIEVARREVTPQRHLPPE